MTTTIKVKINQQFNGRPAGTVWEYPARVALGLIDDGMAVETDEPVSEDELQKWSGPDLGAVEREQVAREEALQDRIAELERALAESAEPKKRGRPPKSEPVTKSVNPEAMPDE